MSPTPRLAWLLAALAVLTLLLPPLITAAAAAALVVAAAVDAWRVRTAPRVARSLQPVLVRGQAAPLRASAAADGTRRVRLRQAAVPDVDVQPREGDGRLEATVVGRRRGRHSFPGTAARNEGPLGLGCTYHRAGEDEELLVYPDVPAARRLALAVRYGRFREQGLMSRGPLGLGTEFESVRDYLPDDDVRQINWAATARTAKPMSNQYRIEQDRDVICLLDTGRLMSAPVGDRTRLDAAVDAATAVALVADELGDRCGAIAFDRSVHRVLAPRRSAGNDVVKAIFDLEPSAADSDYEAAFRRAARGKRALVFVFTDVLDEAAAGVLIASAPLLARRHAVVVASTEDADLRAAVTKRPDALEDVLAAGAAVEMLGARERVVALLRRAGAEAVEAPAERLGAACVRAYLRAKARARL